MKKVMFIAKILIIACLILAGILVFSGPDAGSFFFLDPLLLILVLLGTVGLTIMGFSFPEIGRAFKHALGTSGEFGKGELERSIYFWEAAARNFYLTGVLMAIISFATLINSSSRPSTIQSFLSTMSLCSITAIYGLILAALCAIAGLRVNNKLHVPGLSQQEILEAAAKTAPNRLVEKTVGALLFIGVLGWIILKAEAVMVFIYWPVLLVVVGGAILFVLCVGNGADGLSTTLGFTFSGVIGVLFGLAQMFNGNTPIKAIVTGMTFTLLSCVFAMVGMMLGGVHRQDHTYKTGKSREGITISRIAWYGFPVLVLMVLFYFFLMTIMPMGKVN